MQDLSRAGEPVSEQGAQCSHAASVRELPHPAPVRAQVERADSMQPLSSAALGAQLEPPRSLHQLPHAARGAAGTRAELPRLSRGDHARGARPSAVQPLPRAAPQRRGRAGPVPELSRLAGARPRVVAGGVAASRTLRALSHASRGGPHRALRHLPSGTTEPAAHGRPPAVHGLPHAASAGAAEQRLAVPLWRLSPRSGGGSGHVHRHPHALQELPRSAPTAPADLSGLPREPGDASAPLRAAARHLFGLSRRSQQRAADARVLHPLPPRASEPLPGRGQLPALSPLPPRRAHAYAGGAPRRGRQSAGSALARPRLTHGAKRRPRRRAPCPCPCPCPCFGRGAGIVPRRCLTHAFGDGVRLGPQTGSVRLGHALH